MERSESGQPIYRHKGREREFEPAVGHSETIGQIEQHIERHIGPIVNVYHELMSELVHIDVHIVEPTAERDYYTLVTSGMSDRPMNAPEGAEHLRYAELVLGLPADWPMEQDDWKNDENYLPVRLLKFLARFPHEYDTWLWSLHTVPNGDPPQPYAGNTTLCGAMLLPPITTDEEFWELAADDEKRIHFFGVVPLHADEMELKLKEGADSLFDGFDEHGVSEVLDPGRPSTADKPSGWFGFGRK